MGLVPNRYPPSTSCVPGTELGSGGFEDRGDKTLPFRSHANVAVGQATTDDRIRTSILKPAKKLETASSNCLSLKMKEVKPKRVSDHLKTSSTHT